jgi:processive 1,2-diacylglycerol beta-glucosyltransferase
MLVVCAKNKKLFSRLKRKKYSGVKVFGYVDNIEEFMAVSDIIITKPGGLSISELLVRELVPIFISAIPGQETENVRALQEYGVGISLNEPGEIRKTVLDYKRHPHKMERAKKIIRQIKKPDAAREIYRVIC